MCITASSITFSPGRALLCVCRLEGGKRGEGMALPPVLYHATRIVLISGLSALISNMAGVKLRMVGLK